VKKREEEERDEKKKKQKNTRSSTPFSSRKNPITSKTTGLQRERKKKWTSRLARKARKRCISDSRKEKSSTREGKGTLPDAQKEAEKKGRSSKVQLERITREERLSFKFMKKTTLSD